MFENWRLFFSFGGWPRSWSSASLRPDLSRLDPEYLRERPRGRGPIRRRASRPLQLEYG